MTVDLSAYAGQERPRPLRVHDRRRRGPQGWEVTDVAVGNTVLPASAFSTDGWIRVDGLWQQKTDRYYIAEYRTYDGFDESLQNCYQFNAGYANWVDWFSYNRGLHLIYRDTFYAGQRRGHAPRATAAGWSSTPTLGRQCRLRDGGTDYLGVWRPRIQVRDASFSLRPTQTQSIYFADYGNLQSDGSPAPVGERTAQGKAAQP